MNWTNDCQVAIKLDTKTALRGQRDFFVQAKVLQATRRGHFQITDRGRQLLQQNHPQITNKVLRQYPEFVKLSLCKPWGQWPIGR